MRRVGALLAFLALTLAADRARATLPAEQPYRIDYHGRLVTNVTINGRGPFRFLIDTASSRSLMFEHVRKALNLARSQPDQMTVYGINDVAEVMPVKPDRLDIAGQNVSAITMGVLPEIGSNGPDGILGLDVLARYFVILNRAAMTIRLLPPDTSLPPAYAGWWGTELTPRPLKKLPVQFWYLKTQFNDVGVNSLFDLGADLTMLNWGAAERLGARKSHYSKYGPPPEMVQDVLGKEAPAVRANGVSVRLSGKEWAQQAVMIADAPIFTYFELDEHPSAIMGLDLLGNNSLAIDFARQRLYLGPTVGSPARASDPCPAWAPARLC
ncbi:MAG TPA: aspartyl protease family protein [Rhizomicrobium sp.]|nr:aspartyl protease family protein [Rhizomicrobium sp.]